jgi:hypothetical protein
LPLGGKGVMHERPVRKLMHVTPVASRRNRDASARARAETKPPPIESPVVIGRGEELVRIEQHSRPRGSGRANGAGRFMHFESDGPEQAADAIAQEIGRDVDDLDVESDGARRAAAAIAELL